MSRRGYTLLEVLLVLAITTVLIAAVGSAINIYLRSVEAGRAEVEQAQLARALLRRIADDLRSAVPIAPADGGVESSTDAISSAASSLASGGGTGSSGSSSGGSGGGGSGSSSSANIQNITGSTGVTNIDGSQGVTDLSKSGSSGSSGGSSSGSGGSSGGSGASGRGGSSSGSTSGGGSGSSGMSGSSSGGSSSSGSGTSSTGSETSTDEAASTGETTVAPLGVYGSQYDLQVDVSRLPRTDRMDSLTGTIVSGNGAAAFDPPSDVKTVNYYIAAQAVTDSAAATSTPSAGVAAPTTGGLVRREVDRSVINYGTLYGGSSEVGTSEQLLAPEATAIEFRYFDGTEWLTDWSSSDRSAVPVAVEILLTLRAPDEAAAGTTWLVASPAVPQEQTYRLLVHLPAGQPSSAGDASLATESATGDASSTTGASP
ncbi:MAG: prepilin-type N-terminal cleavage/methylation domain-containing protein [Planctomycetales bacterium]|nr:prepilin-type N-terminal cleavage/methylation domain-containing protein [Planctomycetales bacterium]MBN8627048.1 prepilin-type N-terminal cleavage/methylation domain-containing protein [Planctomycetota bacterium]